MNVRIRYLLLALIFLNGYVSLSLELIALRQMASFVGSTAVTASIIIGVFLAFMSWGYYQGSIFTLNKINIRTTVYKSFIIIAVMVILSGSFALVEAYFSVMTAIGINSNIIKTFIYSFIFLSIAPFLFGLNTALIARYLHRYNRDYTGKIMAIDTIGSVLGSLLTTLILMPIIGVNYTLILIVAISLYSAYITKSKSTDLIWFVIIIVLAYSINNDKFLYSQYNIVENNAVSTTSIYEDDEGKSKVIMINGGGTSKYSKDKDLNFPYVKYIEDNFINTMPKDKKMDVLILGAGGFTMGDKDEYHNYTFIDIDKSLLEISEEFFLEKKLAPNKEFIVQDANQFLKDTDKMYDLIILDTYSSLNLIPQDLITAEYMQRVKNRLKPDGIVVMNLISSPNFGNEFTTKLDNTIRFVFKNNIQRQVIRDFNAWDRNSVTNVIYVYYNVPNSNKIYTNNKNSMIYDM